MANPPKAKTLLQAYPSLDTITTLIGGLEAYLPNPYAELALHGTREIEKLFRKELQAEVRALEKENQTAGVKPQLLKDITAVEAELKSSSRTLQDLMNKRGLSKSVQQVLKDHNGTVPVLQALIESLKGTKDAVLAPLAAELRHALGEFSKAQERVAAGGHPGFDEKTSAVLLKVWTQIDVSYDVIGICMRSRQIPFDPVYAGRPTTPSPFRVQLLKAEAKPKPAVPPKKKPTATPAVTKKTLVTKSSEGNTESTMTDEVAKTLEAKMQAEKGRK